MATSYSPKIITDGLVLCLDAADKKSLLAPTTTNLANNSNGTINWTTADLGATVRTQSTVDANSYHYRFVLDKGSDNNAQLRFAFDHTNLTNGETYIMSYKYKITSGSGSFYITDFCDQSVTRVTTDIGDGWYYETAYGTRSSYTETHDFFDTLATENMTVDVKEIQVEHTSASSPLATPFVSYQRQWKDRAGSNNGTLVNMNDQSNFSSEGRGSLIFDGSSDYISLPNDLGYSTNSVSVFGWYKINGNPANSYHVICGDSALELSIHSSATYLRNGVVTTNGRFVSNNGNQNLNDGNYHYYGFTFNGSTKTAYIDSVAVGTQSVTGTLTTSFGVRKIGAFSGGYYANGNVPSYKVYNKVLTSVEVLQNYNATKGRFGL